MREPCNFLLVEDNADDVVLVEHAFKGAGAPHRLHAVSGRKNYGYRQLSICLSFSANYF